MLACLRCVIGDSDFMRDNSNWVKSGRLNLMTELES